MTLDLYSFTDHLFSHESISAIDSPQGVSQTCDPPGLAPTDGRVYSAMAAQLQRIGCIGRSTAWLGCFEAYRDKDEHSEGTHSAEGPGVRKDIHR